MSNLLQPEPTALPGNPAAEAALDAGTPAAEVAAEHPQFSEAWAKLADDALAGGDTVAAYAYARTGYHRGLDQLRRAGWKGHGPIPWDHRPNQGFLRSLAALAKAAERIGETDEYERCKQFLVDSDPAAAEATGLE
ncbi:DUF3151 domain-containing protein [Thermocrispum municipale]|jgi:hypothetical protein|uniref:DUF3151 domain-containing protein n=1 Tax=Thermocrispum municipale TaxID=37926 RepID=UPI00048C597A|nr:DUF3151 domain-containing protein [Thermocrispum municipale]